MKKELSRLISLFMSVVVATSLFQFVPISWTLRADNSYYYDTVYNTGKDNGYSQQNEIKSDDCHYGWKLGKFCVSGFTRKTDDNDKNPIFLKTVGNTVKLSFILDQDIDLLNGDKTISINDDQNGFDQYFATEKQDCGRGMLIVKKTDYQNLASDPVIYNDYLVGKNVGAEVDIDLFEEGDYEVALDYEIKKTNINFSMFGQDVNTGDSYSNYRIFFEFSVRNGNCMVFPFDVKTHSELTSGAVSKDGFYLDLANSRYLNIDIQKQVYVESDKGLVTDTRFNRPATDGEEYTDEGIYIIKVSNIYTGESTEKIIYVGSDPVLTAYAVTGVSIDQIRKMVANGATITENGEIITANSEVYSSEPETTEEEWVEPQYKISDKGSSGMPIPVIVIVVVVVIGVAAVFVWLKVIKKNKSNQNELQLQDNIESKSIDENEEIEEKNNLDDINPENENDET